MIERAKKNESVLSGLIEPTVLNSLPKATQKNVIDTLKDTYTKEKDGGMLGIFLGTNKANASMHIAFILCIILMVIGFLIGDKDVWDKIFTLIGATLGYIFGASQKEK